MINKSRTLLHTIDTLTTGGAEVLLKHTISLLPEFDHIVVYLNSSSELEKHFESQGVKVICLDHSGWLDFPVSVIKLRRIIKENNPVLVHSHLFYSTLLSRFAVPALIPLVSTLHSMYSKDAFEKNSKSILAERLSLRKRHSLIAVSHFVLQDYLKFISFKGKSFVLYNFLPDNFFQKKTNFSDDYVRFIAVGNLKSAKNYEYLLQVFKCLKNEKITLDIYGDGPLYPVYKEIVDRENLNVTLCGNTNKMPGVYRGYDFYIQASSHEGFGLSVAEAMASGLPCFLSDIPVFHEVTAGKAFFFTLNDPQVAAGLIMSFIQDKSQAEALSDEGFTLAQLKYSATRYKQDLLAIYKDLVPEKI
jgi:glycosyltransferase involved in cell wall biosynthesis